MSRSIHVTRRTLLELKQFDFADAEERRARLRRARDTLRRKRTIKGQMREERAADATGAPDEPGEPATADTIHIFTRPSGPFVHYPACETGLRAVMRLLPPGILDGVRRITLEPSIEYLREQAESEECEPDPLTGRHGIEILPSVYCGPVLGTYDCDTATIALHGYVYDRTAMPDCALRELYLHLHMLSTLLHELGHHVDRTSRVARGRWLCIPGDKAEEFAEQQEEVWTREYAVSYLQHRYPDAVRAFEEWTAHYGGVRVLFPQPAESAPDDLFNVGLAFRELVAAVDAQKPLRETRLGFANGLRYAGCYNEALQSVEFVLADYPNDPEALTAKGFILMCLERHDDAEQAAIAAIEHDAHCLDAWCILARVYREAGRWDQLETAATQILRLKSEMWQRNRALADRAAAQIELGDFAAAESDIEELSRQRGKLQPRRAAVLRAVSLLRQGQYEAALAAAEHLLSSAKRHLGSEPELLATRVEASHALGRLRQDQMLNTMNSRGSDAKDTPSGHSASWLYNRPYALPGVLIGLDYSPIMVRCAGGAVARAFARVMRIATVHRDLM
jgi:tetratricopeptide (TPR) repeat protein